MVVSKRGASVGGPLSIKEFSLYSLLNLFGFSIKWFILEKNYRANIKKYLYINQEKF